MLTAPIQAQFGMPRDYLGTSAVLEALGRLAAKFTSIANVVSPNLKESEDAIDDLALRLLEDVFYLSDEFRFSTMEGESLDEDLAGLNFLSFDPLTNVLVAAYFLDGGPRLLHRVFGIPADTFTPLEGLLAYVVVFLDDLWPKAIALLDNEGEMETSEPREISATAVTKLVTEARIAQARLSQ